MAETSITIGVDSQGAYIGAHLNRFINASDQTVTLSDGIGAFDAYLTYSSASASMKAGAGVAPFTTVTTSLDVAGGEYGARATAAASQSASAPTPPLELFRFYPWLTGSSATPVAVKLRFNSITRTGGLAVSQKADASKTFRRGDANNDGLITIVDALFVAQHLAGLRGFGETTDKLNPVNAATARNDSASGSSITITDALVIAQMLAGLRDASFNLP